MQYSRYISFYFLIYIDNHRLSLVGGAICLLLTCSTPLFADEIPHWEQSTKNTLIQACYTTSAQQTTAAYKSLFYMRISNAVYEDFLVVNSQHLVSTCQCVINRLTATYTPEQLSSDTQQLLTDTSALIGRDGPCQTDVDQVMANLQSRLRLNASGNPVGVSR